MEIKDVSTTYYIKRFSSLDEFYRYINETPTNDAFKNATNFLNTIKSEQASDNLSSKKVSRKK